VLSSIDYRIGTFHRHSKFGPRRFPQARNSYTSEFDPTELRGHLVSGRTYDLRVRACTRAACVTFSRRLRAKSTKTPRSLDPSSALPASCAAIEPLSVPPNDWASAQRAMAPPGASFVRLCRYAGLNAARRLTLVRSALDGDPGVVGAIVAAFNQLPAPVPGSGVTACPASDESAIVALLVYPDGHSATIRVALTGCAPVTNGDLYRSAAGFGTPRPYGPQLIALLELQFEGNHPV